ncbi:hypothetical protein [Polaromonas sp.]|jgi:hypothetical protein|uniref:hypothetical protein n=1 Tax=Polaromonas sp. TaxID=1869339 RepID=UPI002BB3EE22|nr:hypothetical protein [Polaromonas sp.]HQS33507.1 hypothetical protein [Polaromonas sp.]HQS91814.1 hypothetical protein [Polaromonas sp.]
MALASMRVIRQHGLRWTTSDLMDVWVSLFFFCTAHRKLAFIVDDRLLPPETAINVTPAVMDWQRPFDGLVSWRGGHGRSHKRHGAGPVVKAGALP